MKKYLPYIFIILIGVLVMSYPRVSDYLSGREHARVIDEYDQTVSNLTEERRYELLEEARAYNDALQRGESVSAVYYVETLNLGEVMGTLTIPKINVNLPIYHGTSEAVLQKGIGHLEGTSLPAGDLNTHAVLTGHRGLPSSTLLTHLDQMAVNDTFYISLLGSTMAYRVVSVLIIEPESYDSSVFALYPDKCLVTLLTCHPYGVNTHRLLVTGERVEDYDPTEFENYQKAEAQAVALKATGTDEAEAETGFLFYIGTPRMVAEIAANRTRNGKAIALLCALILFFVSVIIRNYRHRGES